MYPLNIAGKRVGLRELVSEDREPLGKILHSDATSPSGILAEPAQLLSDEIAGSVTGNRRRYTLAVDRLEPRALIGLAVLDLETPNDRRARAWLVLSPHQRGKGLGAEAGRLLLSMGFETLGLHRIYATCDPRDLPLSRALSRMGMRLEGHLRHHRREAGVWRDTLLYATVEDEWTRGVHPLENFE
jgi:ribosomal-protein-alanine N-acetyltransferase